MLQQMAKQIEGLREDNTQKDKGQNYAELVKNISLCQVNWH